MSKERSTTTKDKGEQFEVKIEESSDGNTKVTTIITEKQIFLSPEEALSKTKREATIEFIKTLVPSILGMVGIAVAGETLSDPIINGKFYSMESAAGFIELMAGWWLLTLAGEHGVRHDRIKEKIKKLEKIIKPSKNK